MSIINLPIETELGKAVLRVHHYSCVTVQVSPKESGNTFNIRGIEYDVDMTFRLKNTDFGIWEVEESRSGSQSVYRTGMFLQKEGNPTATAQKKIYDVVSNFVNKWCNSPEGKRTRQYCEIKSQSCSLTNYKNKEERLRQEFEAELAKVRESYEKAEKELQKTTDFYGGERYCLLLIQEFETKDKQ